MSLMKKLLQRIFGDKEIPPGLGKEEFQAFMDENITRFEESGYLEETKLPPIQNEDDFVDKLYGAQSDLIIIKYWKRRCLPCLSMAEMYKQAEQHYLQEKESSSSNGVGSSSFEERKPFVRFFSINSKDPATKVLINRQMIEGTPTVQLFHCGRQIGTSIEATNLQDFIRDVELERARLPLQCPE